MTVKDTSTIVEFEREVFATEGIRIVLRTADPTVTPAKYSGRRLSDMLSVKDFKKIVEVYLPDTPFVIIGGTGKTPLLKTSLGTLRASYTPVVSTTKPNAKKTSLTKFMDMNVELRKDAKKAIERLALHGLESQQAKAVLVALAALKMKPKVDASTRSMAETTLIHYATYMGVKFLRIKEVMAMFERETEGRPGSAADKLGHGESGETKESRKLLKAVRLSQKD